MADLRVVGDADPYKNNKEVEVQNNVGASIARPQETKTISKATDSSLPTNKKSEPVNSTIARPQKSENVSYWSNVINNLKQLGKVMIYTNLINTNAREINDLTLGIEFPNGLTAFGKTVLEKPENMQELVKQVSIEAGKEMRIKLIDLKASNKLEAKSDNGLSSLGININIIDN